MKEDFFENLENRNNTIKCPNCGKDTRKDLSTCNHCGHSILIMNDNNHISTTLKSINYFLIALGIIYLLIGLNSDVESFTLGLRIGIIIELILFNKCVAELLQILHDIRKKLYMKEKK